MGARPKRTRAAGTARRAALTAGLAAAAILPAMLPAAGQERGGPLLTFGIDTSLRADDNIDLVANPDGGDIRSETRLSFGLSSATRLQRLALTADTGLRFSTAAGDESGFERPTLSLDYLRQTRSARLAADLSYRTTDLGFFDPATLDEELRPEDLVAGTGQVTRYSAALALETGLQAPVGLELSLATQGRSYSGTTSPNLTDSRTDSAGAAVVLRPDRATEGRIGLSVSEYSSDGTGITDRSTRSLDLGASRRLSEAVEVSAALSLVEIEETSASGATASDRGLSARLEMRRALPAGSLGAAVESDLTNTGRRTTVEIDRNFRLPRGALSFSLGASAFEDGDPEIVGSLGYSRDLPTGTIGAQLERRLDSTSDDLRQTTTRASLDYSYQINDLSSLSLDMNFVALDVASGASSARASLTTTYTRSLTRDWDLALGYEHRYVDPSSGSQARSNAVFLSIGRDFQIRP